MCPSYSKKRGIFISVESTERSLNLELRNHFKIKTKYRMNANENMQVVSALVHNIRKRAMCVEPTEFRQ